MLTIQRTPLQNWKKNMAKEKSPKRSAQIVAKNSSVIPRGFLKAKMACCSIIVTITSSATIASMISSLLRKSNRVNGSKNVERWIYFCLWKWLSEQSFLTNCQRAVGNWTDGTLNIHAWFVCHETVSHAGAWNKSCSCFCAVGVPYQMYHFVRDKWR